MLKIHFGRAPEDKMLVRISDYFDAMFEDEWMSTDLTKRIIKEIDKSTLLYPRIIDSPWLGPITPREISGGAKGLILMAYDDDMLGRYFFGGQFGDNTLPLMWEISKTRDILFAQVDYMDYPMDTNIPIYIEKYDLIVKTPKEYKMLKERMLHRDPF